MVNRTILLGSCIFFTFFFSSCRERTVLNGSRTLPAGGWAYTEPVFFETCITDTLSPYDFTFSLKHSEHYPWSNAFFLITTVFPDMETSIDTLECILATREGYWLGRKTGKTYSMGFLYKARLRFPQTGNYRFEIRHAMRDDTLHGILSTGMKIKKAK